MLVPDRFAVLQLPVPAETIEVPGANRSGLRRPSAVGPTPPPPLLTMLVPFSALPTAIRFLAFSGFFRVDRFVSENSTRLSSLVQANASIALQCEL